MNTQLSRVDFSELEARLLMRGAGRRTFQARKEWAKNELTGLPGTVTGRLRDLVPEFLVPRAVAATKSKSMTRNEQIAWAAGIMDGEGCICITRCTSSRSDMKTKVQYRLMVKVSMGSKATVDKLAEILGLGTVSHVKATHGRENDHYCWIVMQRKAEEALNILLPFMLTKAAEAGLALEFMALPLGWTGGANGNAILSEEIQIERERIYWLLRRMKPTWRFYKERLSEDDAKNSIYREALRRKVTCAD